jgi:HAMP domain-containing protein
MASSQAKPMPQTIEGYQALADRDLILIESMRDEIGMLKAKINKLEQKLNRNNVEQEGVRKCLS